MGKQKTHNWADDYREAKHAYLMADREQAQPPIESRALPSHLIPFENLLSHAGRQVI